MTLSTDIYVLDPVNVHELFLHCQGLLTKYDEQHRPPRQQACSDTPRHEIWKDPGSRSLSNQIGQNLPAILDITYRPNAPLRAVEQADECTDDCDPADQVLESDGERYHHHPRACWVDIDFDTAYGYRDSEGRGCGDLHALLVAGVGAWLDQRGIRWEWENEFTSEVHGGPDRYERLVDLASGGFEASAWFRTTVAPAIAAMHARAEGA